MGSIITSGTKSRSGYSKTESGKRMKISERNTYKNSENPIFALELHKTVLADKYGYGGLKRQNQAANKEAQKNRKNMTSQEFIDSYLPKK